MLDLLKESKDEGVHVHEKWLKKKGLIRLNKYGSIPVWTSWRVGSLWAQRWWWPPVSGPGTGHVTLSRGKVCGEMRKAEKPRDRDTKWVVDTARTVAQFAWGERLFPRVTWGWGASQWEAGRRHQRRCLRFNGRSLKRRVVMWVGSLTRDSIGFWWGGSHGYCCVRTSGGVGVIWGGSAWGVKEGPCHQEEVGFS